MHWIPLSFFLLIGISLSARLLRSDGFMAFSLRTVPAICAFMGAIFTLWLAVLPYVSKFAASPLLILIPPPAILAAGFAFHVSRSRKRGISAMRAALSFAAGFALSLAVTAAAIAANLAVHFNTWRSVEIPSSPKCFLEMRARVAFCPEFDRRIAFESGKRVGICIDTCGLDKFGVCKLANGAIYLESENGFGNSYIIDSKNEKVYEALGSSAVELKGGLICGRDGGDCGGEVVYETYGDGGENGKFKSVPIPAAKLLVGKKFIGRLSKRAFSPCAEPERQPPAPPQTR